jgi:hypothetical protein
LPNYSITNLLNPLCLCDSVVNKVLVKK